MIDYAKTIDKLEADSMSEIDEMKAKAAAVFAEIRSLVQTPEFTNLAPYDRELLFVARVKGLNDRLQEGCK